MREPNFRCNTGRLAGGLMALAMLAGSAAAQTCPPDGWSRESLAALKAAQWKLDDAARREALANGLLDCLANPDPLLRDQLAFEGLAAWMRAQQLSVPTMHRMTTTLAARLGADQPDPTGFAKPFAALVLSEVARADRVQPFLGTEERRQLVETAARYVAGVRDYRGFDPKDGWRHGVAHGADLLMQLAANPALIRADHERILEAVAAQVTPAGEHFYVYGEGERLARPVLLVARRGTLDATAWSTWLARVASAGSFNNWEAALRTPAGLARRHNLSAFLLVLYVGVRESADEGVRQTLLPGLTAALRNLP